MQEGYGTRRIAPHPAPSCGRQNESAQLRTVGRLILVVEYSSSANTHPVGVRCAVPGLPPNEEYGGHPRICSNHLTGSGNSLPVRVSTSPSKTLPGNSNSASTDVTY